MNEDLDQFFPQGEPLDAAVLEKLRAQAAAPSTPVRPLPSNAVLWTISIGIFLAVSLLVAWAVKFKAVGALSSGEMIVYYGLIALFAGFFGRAVIERMIPGERRLMPAGALWIAAPAALAVLMVLLYPDRGMDRFVETGVPCLRLGALSAFVSGLLGWRLLRRGYLVSPAETITLYGFFAGLVGVAVLALHCPIRNSMHCLVWHLGAMVIAGLVGVMVGNFVENHSHAD